MKLSFPTIYRLGADQPRPQGLPRGGARAEEDPGKIRWNLQDSWRFIACAVTTTLCCWLQLALALTIFLLKNIHVLLIVYVFILKILTNFTKKYFRYKLWTHTYTKLCNIHHHIVSICRSMALIFVTLFCLFWQPSYISDAVRLQMRPNIKHW